jgi:hypothetical protein
VRRRRSTTQPWAEVRAGAHGGRAEKGSPWGQIATFDKSHPLRLNSCRNPPSASNHLPNRFRPASPSDSRFARSTARPPHTRLPLSLCEPQGPNGRPQELDPNNLRAGKARWTLFLFPGRGAARGQVRRRILSSGLLVRPGACPEKDFSGALPSAATAAPRLCHRSGVWPRRGTKNTKVLNPHPGTSTGVSSPLWPLRSFVAVSTLGCGRGQAAPH